MKSAKPGVITLGIKAAFPSIWYGGLIAKMTDLGFLPIFVKIIANFCDQAVKWDTAMSDPVALDSDLPRGCAPSFLLYNVYTSDLPTHQSVDVLTFADDTAIVASAVQCRSIVSKLNAHIVRRHAFYIKWRITMNATKT